MNGKFDVEVLIRDHAVLERNSYVALPPANLFMALLEFTAELWTEKLLNMIYQQPQISMGFALIQPGLSLAERI